MSGESGRNKQFSLENNQKFIIKREEVYVGTVRNSSFEREI